MSFDLNQISKRNNRYGIHDIRDLVLHLAADGQKKNWMNVIHHSNIQHTVVLMVSGITSESLGINKPAINATHPFSLSAEDAEANKLPIINQLYSHGLPVRAPGDSQRLYSPAQHILNSPIPPPEKLRQQKVAQEKAGVNLSNPGKLSPPVFLIDIDQMRENAYPMPSWLGDDVRALPDYPLPLNDGIEDPKPLDNLPVEHRTTIQEDGWLETPKLDIYPRSNNPQVYGLDCEMVMTDQGSELARVTLIDYATSQKVLDELVKPAGNVVDYLSKYSGITREILDGAVLNHEEAQRKFADFITPSTILLGHSLESDFKAIKLRHPWVIDTALVYEHPRRMPFKPSLKWLMKKWCDKDIQSGNDGHDPEEDAKSCLELLRKKIQYGRNFGSLPNDMESIFARIARVKQSHLADTNEDHKVGACVDYGNPAQFHGMKAKTSISCKNDDEVIDGIIKTAQDHDLVYGRLTELQIALGWSNTSNDKETTRGDSDNTIQSAPLDSAYQALNERIKRLHDALKPNTALVIISPHSDPRPSLELNQRRLAFQDLYKAANTDVSKIDKDKIYTREDDERLLHEAEIAKSDRGCKSPQKVNKSHNNAWGFMNNNQTPSSKANKKRKSTTTASTSKIAFASPASDDSDLDIISTSQNKKIKKKDIPPAPIFQQSQSNSQGNLQKAQPLAEKVRPNTLDGYVGQDDLMGENGILRDMIVNDTISSSLLWGPPGSGKTTLARIIAKTSRAKLKEISATNTGVNEAKQILDQAKATLQVSGTRTIIFVDELHRYSKLQQDIFLPHIESGACVLIGATTENPSFKINNALLSRCQIYKLEKLTMEALTRMLSNALTHWKVANEGYDINALVDDDFVRYLASISDGDGRVALNSLEMVLRSVEIRRASSSAKPLTKQDLMGSLKRSIVLKYDRDGDFHYDSISAFHKSLRGSDVNASVYWLARMLEAGEDPLYVCRRMVVVASEDIGMADSYALTLATATYQACQVIGMPECRINLAHCCVYLAEAPKSTRSYEAYNKAVAAVKMFPQYPVPLHLRNAPTRLMKDLNYGKDYLYNPAYDHPVHQEYFPDEMPQEARIMDKQEKAHNALLLAEWEQVNDKKWDGNTSSASTNAPKKCPKGLGR
ncbi:hypothetical protein E3Q12_03815 [Wallemia mellicola]|nr:hypothetical protein E3Q12_03815 [Wallemia mellicola]